MDIRIEVDEGRVCELVRDFLATQLGDLAPSMADIRIEVKSKRNYRSEWEPAKFRAVYEKHGA